MAKNVKAKHSKKTHRIKRDSSGDLLSVQISVKLKRVPKGFKFTRAMIEELIRKKALLSTGEWIQRPGGGFAYNCKAGPNPPGIELTIISWTNPDRYGRSSGERFPIDDLPVGTGQDEAWGTLRRPIISGRFAIQLNR